MSEIKTFLHKTLSSRKFWAAVASSIPFLVAQDWDSFATVWMTYAGIQGAVDATEAVGSRKSREALEIVAKAKAVAGETK